MDIETLGDAWTHGVRLTVCAWGSREGLKSIRECDNRYELDVYSMLWTRGRDFPLGMLSSRMRCPKCGSRRVAVRITCRPRPAPRAPRSKPVARFGMPQLPRRAGKDPGTSGGSGLL
jgi:hypothetical protein